jgi:AcrR family transcriptional regulator
MATSGGAANSRLSVDDWVQEGFRVLAEDGVKALTLGRLCSRLAVTKGSFYWHFSDMKAYREALIDTWAAVRDEDRGSFDDLASEPPASDQRVVAAVRQAFLDDGFDPEQADMRANATFAAGIGFLHLSGSRPSPVAAGRREEFLEVMLRH